MTPEKIKYLQGFFFLFTLVNMDAPAAATPTAPEKKMTVYRCEDANGKVSLQDSPCAKSSKQEAREMVRPKDVPPTRQTISAKPVPVATPATSPRESIPLIPPPVLYQCTNYEGKTRDSENYDPNPRCEPLWAQGYQMENVPIENRTACSWIQDSCVRYEGRALCDRWKVKQKKAESDLRYAFSDTLAYRKSELARINQIVQDSCP